MDNVNSSAKIAIILDTADTPIGGEEVPLLQNAAGRWPNSLIREGAYYDFDEALTEAHSGTPVYKLRPSTS